MVVKLTTKETKQLLRKVAFDSVRRFNEKGITPTTYKLAGKPGISKTSIAKEMQKYLEEACGSKVNIYPLRAAERGTDITSIMGYPKDQVYTKELGWTNEKRAGDYEVLNTRMKYSPPHWLPLLEETKFSILVLDDNNRGHPSIIQGTMGLIEDKGFADWQLPPGCMVIITENNDENSITEIGDDAQQSRSVNIDVTSVDIEDWRKDYADKYLNEDFTNFIVGYWHEIKESINENVRSVAKWGNEIDYVLEELIYTISNKDKFDKKEGQQIVDDLVKVIERLGESTVGTTVTNLFVKGYLGGIFKDIPNFNELMLKGEPKVLIEQMENSIKKHSGKELVLINIFYKKVFSFMDKLNKTNVEEFMELLNCELFRSVLTTKEFWLNKILKNEGGKYTLILKNSHFQELLK